LFSDNSPTDELLDPDIVGTGNRPDEIWIIQINPSTRRSVPETLEDINDRRNEMIGNASLFQDLQKIELVNSYLKKGAFSEEFVAQHDLKVVAVRIVDMSTELKERLDYSSKIDRNARHIDRLIQDGQRQGKRFLENLP
jgi:NTE family protein